MFTFSQRYHFCLSNCCNQAFESACAINENQEKQGKRDMGEMLEYHKVKKKKKKKIKMQLSECESEFQEVTGDGHALVSTVVQ